jgi:hypothetical protein
VRVLIQVVDGKMKVESDLDQKSMCALLLDVVKATVGQMPAAGQAPSVQAAPPQLHRQLLAGAGRG